MLKTPYDNVQPIDRLARFILGAAMIALIFTPGFNSYWITLASVYPIMTAIMAWDPLYALLGQLQSSAARKSKPLTHAPA